jgi:hypothetical protein
VGRAGEAGRGEQRKQLRSPSARATAGGVGAQDGARRG